MGLSMCRPDVVHGSKGARHLRISKEEEQEKKQDEAEYFPTRTELGRDVVPSDLDEQLTDRERKYMNCIRVRLKEKYPQHSQIVNDEEDMRFFLTLVRFVRGGVTPELRADVAEPEKEKLKIEEAVDALNSYLKYETKYKVESLPDVELKHDAAFHHLWCNGVSGVDRNGRVVIAAHPWYNSLMDWNNDDLIRHHARDVEIASRLKEELIQLSGRLELQHVMILDFHDDKSIDRERIFWFPKTFVFEDRSIDGVFYQDSLFRVYILNASFALRVLWNVARMFMHPVTAQKVQIFAGSGPDVIKALIDQGIPLTAIPSYLHKDALGANPIGMIDNTSRRQVLNVSGKKETKTSVFHVAKHQDVRWSIRVQGRSSHGARVHVRLVCITTKNKSKKTICKFNLVSKYPNSSSWRAPEDCDVLMVLSHDLTSLCDSTLVELQLSVLDSIRLPPNRRSDGSGSSNMTRRLGKKKRTIPQLTMSAYDIL